MRVLPRILPKALAAAAAVICSLDALSAANAPTVRLGADATVRLDGDDARLQFVLFTSRSSCLEPVNENAERVGSDLSVNYRFVKLPNTVLGSGRATLRATGASAAYSNSITAHSGIKSQPHGFRFRLQASVFNGLKWTADSKTLGFPSAPEHTIIASGEAKSFTFDFPGGRKWTIGFPKTVKFEASDLRRQNGSEFEVRFTLPRKLDLAIGKGADVGCTLTAADGKPQIAARDVHVIGQGSDWVKLDRTTAIRPSSALDFSRIIPRRAPIGADGRLSVSTNGEFRNSRRPAETVRLFGCQVGGGELFVDKQSSAAYTKTLSRMGYNAIRLARLDSRLLTEGAKGLQCNAGLAEKLDQLVTAAGRDGLYSIIDVANEKKWSWADLGLTAPGKEPPSSNLAAAYFLLDERAFGAWKRLANAVYGRRNVVGRRNYPEDPAVPLALALADVSPFGAWNDLRTQPDIRAQYGRWLEAKRKADPDFMRDSVCEAMDLGVMPVYERKAGAIRLFLAEAEIAGLEKMKAHLASLKAKSLVGSALGWRHFQDVAGLRATAGDFTCDSFHIDSPRYMGERYRVPCRIDNSNPLEAASPLPACMAWHERPDRATCITSWNAQGPSSWRALSGLLVGAWAAKHHWAALIRSDNPLDDPLRTAAERAVATLYARGDMAANAPDDAFVIEKGGLTVKTPRTVGGFSPETDGRIVAAPLAVTLKGARAAVWVSSLTDAPVTSSKRLLLTHLTEMQLDGTLFADSHCDLMLRRGTGPWLVRDGSAAIELAVEKPSSFKVFVLGSDGTRSVRVPTDTKDGLLTFTAAVRGSKNAQYLYEITRE